MANVLVFVEQREGSLKKYSLEVLSEGRRVADTTGGHLAAVVAASAELAGSLAEYGAEKVFHAADPAWNEYSTEACTGLVVEAAREFQADILLGAASSMGKDLMPRVSARLDVGLAPDCTQLTCGPDGRLELVRPIFAGKAYATLKLRGTPQMATLRPNVFKIQQAPARSAADLVSLDGRIHLDAVRARVVETTQVAGQTLELTEAEIVVSGGRGLKGPENFYLVENLAEVLGAAVGASRAVVDAGWKEHRFQVGQTGKTVSPTLYVACGISGAIQHLAGMSSSKYIVAVNKDPEAPIFKVADYGIVGDVFQVLPALTEEVRKFKKG